MPFTFPLLFEGLFFMLMTGKLHCDDLLYLSVHVTSHVHELHTLGLHFQRMALLLIKLLTDHTSLWIYPAFELN